MSSQAQEMESIDRFVKRFKPSGSTQQKLVQDWNNWWLNLTWYDKNLNSESLKHARLLQQALTSNVGAEKAIGNFAKKGTVVPTPSGYRRAFNREITPQVQAFAKSALANFAKIAKTKGEAALIGMRLSSAIENKQYLAQNEWHFDNHPKGGGPAYWHMGVSIFVPTNPIAKSVFTPVKKSITSISLFRTSDPSLAALSTTNPYA